MEELPMKIIHTSDWHLGKLLNDYSLLADQRHFLNQFISDMLTIQPDVILICGDIYDRSVPSAEAVALLNDTLIRLAQEVRAAVILTAGNHDSKERLSFGSTLLAESGVHLIGRPSYPTEPITLYDAHGPVHFYALPYLDQYDIRPLFPDESLKTNNEAFHRFCQPLLEHLNTAERNVLLAHGFFTAGATDSDLSEQVGGSELISLHDFAAFDYLALGHIHGNRTIGLPHARYSGSPLKYSIDEASQQKSYLLLELGEKGTLTMTEHPIDPLHDVRTLTGSFADVLKRDWHQNQNFDDYVFVNLTDAKPIADVMSQLKAVLPNILGVKFAQMDALTPKSAVSIQQIQTQSPETLFADFYESQTGEPLTPYQTELTHTLFQQAGGNPT